MFEIHQKLSNALNNVKASTANRIASNNNHKNVEFRFVEFTLR